MPAFALVAQTQTFTSSTTFNAPGGLVGTVRARVWGSTSGGGGAPTSSAGTGGGSGGAGYSEEPALAMTGGTGYPVIIPAGGAGGPGSASASGTNPGDTSIAGDAVTVVAHPGLPGQCSNSNGARGTGAPASSNTIAFGGGDGAPGVSSGHGGGGGGGAGSAGNGGSASAAGGGSAGSPDGGAGGNGAAAPGVGNPGSAPTGGGGGAKGGSPHTGGAGATGKIILTFQVLVPLGGRAVAGKPRLRRGTSQSSEGAPFTAVGPPVASPFFQPQFPIRGAKRLRTGTHASSKGAPFALPPPFRLAKFRPPGAIRGRKRLRTGTGYGAKGSPVVPFPAQVVNQWAGTIAQSPVWGTSLPGTPSVVVPLTPASSTGGGTGTPTMGNWLFCVAGWNTGAGITATISAGDDTHQWWRPAQPSSAAGGTRTVIWYQPNILSPTAVYVAPSAYVDGMSVTVIEVGGLGPWDTVVGLTSDALTGTSLPLSLGSPGAGAFFLAAATGSLASAGTSLAPLGWTANTTVTATNGTDATGDTVLASASVTSASAQSITATATATEAMSGMMIAVLENGPSPVPSGINPNWPYLICEAAFGSGYGTPPDQMVWTDLNTSAPNGTRLRGWHESTGVQYELDALESAELELVLDNPDGALTPFNTASPYYPNVVPGTPIRIRAITAAANRWYVIQRNIERWPESWDENLRGLTNAVGTDLWSVVNRELLTCYRAEVENDAPYAWWPCDDGAVNNPTSLVNAAPSNAAPLQIVTAPGGLASSVAVQAGQASIVFEFSAIQAFAADSGWMYGDNDSASWAQTGTGSVSTGRYLQCVDANFPPLSGGVTIEGWWNYTWLETAPPNQNIQFGPQGQPTGTIVLWEMAGLASLTMDTSGHLRMTLGGTTGTVYSGADLRNATWFGVTVSMTQTGWTAWVNGGVLAKATGTGSASSAWTTFTANAVAAGTSGIGNPEISHLAIYPSVLPAPRVISHFMGAYAAFGQLPQPAGLQLQFVPTLQPAPDGIMHSGTFFNPPSTFVGTNSTLAAYVAGSGGALISAVNIPEAWNWCQSNGSGQSAAGNYAWLAATGPASPQYTWFTGSSSGNENQAAVTAANSLFVDSYGGGANPPTAASALGDTVQNRIERFLQAGNVTSPARCIDPAPALVVAALDSGGQAAGSNLANVQASDSGFLSIDNVANLCYFSRPRLAAQPVMWQLGADVQAGQIPYQPEDATKDTDPQRVANDIQVAQFDVTGTGGGAASGSGETHGGLVFGPSASRYPAILASQQQNGAQKVQNGSTSYLQDQSLIQSQVNWIFDEFGNPAERITNLTVKAEAMAVVCPQAWLFVLGANVGDVIQAYFTLPGQPASSGTWRITKITRDLKFDLGATVASVSVIADVYTSEF